MRCIGVVFKLPRYRVNTTIFKRKSPENQWFSGLGGGDKRDRTADLLNAIQALSQLSYTPIFSSLSDSFCIIAHMKEKSRGISLFTTIFCGSEALSVNGTICNDCRENTAQKRCLLELIWRKTYTEIGECFRQYGGFAVRET